MTTAPQDGLSDDDGAAGTPRLDLTVGLTIMNETKPPLAYTDGWTVGQYLVLAHAGKLRRNQRLSVGGELCGLERVIKPGETIIIAPKIRNG